MFSIFWGVKRETDGVSYLAKFSDNKVQILPPTEALLYKIAIVLFLQEKIEWTIGGVAAANNQNQPRTLVAMRNCPVNVVCKLYMFDCFDLSSFTMIEIRSFFIQTLPKQHSLCTFSSSKTEILPVCQQMKQFSHTPIWFWNFWNVQSFMHKLTVNPITIHSTVFSDFNKIYIKTHFFSLCFSFPSSLLYVLVQMQFLCFRSK